jgi:hypothetical protein
MKHVGIRKRGNKYHWCVMRNKERFYGTANTLSEAVTARTNHSKNHVSTVTLQNVIGELITLKWSGQKGFNTLQSALCQ